MKIKGIDVSQWQGDIDFGKVRSAGVDFVIIRAGYGRYISQKDPTFEDNYRKAKSAGLNVGAYWYSYAESEADARAEAAVCMEVIRGKQFEYPIYFDLEEKSQFSRGKAFCSALVTAFCGEMEKAGYFAGLYISRSPLQTYITSEVAERYALWVAEYGSRCNYSGSYGMWQYTSTGKVSGVNGACDCDYAYTDYPSIIKNGGFNGFAKPTEHFLDISGFKKGDKSLGVLALKELLRLAREKGLTSANFDVSHDGFYAGTEKAVNEILTRWGFTPNGIAGENFIKRLGEEVFLIHNS